MAGSSSNHVTASIGPNDFIAVNEEWTPLHSTITWCDSDGRDRMTVSVLIPSGVNDKLEYGVINNGKEFQVSITWPMAMYDVEELWPKRSLETKLEMQRNAADFLLKKAAFRKHNVIIRREKDNRMRSVAKIRLPRISNCECVPSMIARKDGSVIFCADLSCEEKESHTTMKAAGLLNKAM